MSHKKNPVLGYASETNVIRVSIVPHTIQKMHTMDIAVYGPLQIYFQREIYGFQKSHSGHIINQYDVARLFAPAYLKAVSALNTVHVF